MRSLDEGLHTDLGRGTGRLSAGELQLIGLVRAALLDPAVLVLDEATADIDPETARGAHPGNRDRHPADGPLPHRHRPPGSHHRTASPHHPPRRERAARPQLSTVTGGPAHLCAGPLPYSPAEPQDTP
ncbi:hypothetical protein OHA63_36690 [Streptomyces anulatus]|uniref:ATP-binding cassette domain-containing protein n=1 Tax=Streptomyces anulatus TaxID=1892 RepID=UPI002E2FA7C0|nr:hypothetical protein [Streptomyces anulatus]